MPVRTGSILSWFIICSCSLLIGWKVYSLKEGFQLQYLDASQNRFDPYWYNLLLLASHWLKSILAQGGLSAPVPLHQSEQVRSYHGIICSCSLLIGCKLLAQGGLSASIPWRQSEQVRSYWCMIRSCSLLIGWKVYSLKEGFQLQYLDVSQNRFDPIMV